MRKSGLLYCAAAVVGLSAPANAALVTYSFVGIGSGAQQLGPQSIDVPQGNAVGSFSFDPSLADALGNFEYLDTNFRRDLTASLAGDTLSFASRSTDSAYNDFSVTVTFAAGVLNGVFPTSIDFSTVLSSTFYAANGFRFLSGGGGLSLYGSLTRLSATQSSGILPSSSLSIAVGVPEPATWALMLIGFGGMGWAMRRQRAVAQLAA